MVNETGPTPDAACTPKRPRLAREFGELLADPDAPKIHDVVIVGSGYGGSVAAEALADLVKWEDDQKKKLVPISVCVLERGKEYLPGEFPKRFEDMPGHLRQTNERGDQVTGNPEGLFDVRMGADVVALVASGVGGGSLINAGVLLEPDLDDFDNKSEAYALIASLKKGKWYDKAHKALGGLAKNGKMNTIDLHPDANKVKKTGALKSLGEHIAPPSISVSMSDAPNQAMVQLTACELCGDCMSGCNVGAKDSLDANLLDLAERAGAKIYSGASVLSIAQDRDDHKVWTLKVCHTDTSLQRRETGPVKIKARHVILAAGTLGSTEILLRSRTDKLVFSPRLGEGFSCNGDNLAAIYNMGQTTNACADEDAPRGERFVGPTITATVKMHTHMEGAKTNPAKRSFQLQEFSVPGPMKRIFEELVTTAKVLNDLPQCDPHRHGQEIPGALDPMAVDDEAMGRTLLVGTIGHDEADGVLYLPRPLPMLNAPSQQGTVGIRWVSARHGARLDGAHKSVNDAVEALKKKNGSTDPKLVANPLWRLLPEKLESLISQPRGPVLTVHPLGGCRIGPRDVSKNGAGVVDRYGRVRDFSGLPRSIFKTLVVLDGSIIPGSLGVNPSLTITATAMRAMDKLHKAWGYQQAQDALQQPAAAVIWLRRSAEAANVPNPNGTPEQPAGRGSTEIQVVERLRGTVPLKFGGKANDCIVELTLAYRPLPIGQLMSQLQRRMTVDPQDEASRIRIYDQGEWNANHLKLERDEVRCQWALFEGRLSGTLSVLGREPSRPWWRILRSVSAWFVNRGARDIWQRKASPAQTKREDKSDRIYSYFWSLLRMGTHAGEVRRLDYDLAIAEVLPLPGHRTEVDARSLQIGRCDTIRGSKRLTYGRRANPWRQLTQLTIEEMPGMNTSQRPVLELDGHFLAGQGFPLLRITRQRNSAVALADLCSFGLYMARVLVTIHLWTFRKPDTQPRRQPDRLPGLVAGLMEPEITELVVDRYPDTNTPVTIRLTRYRQPTGPRREPGRPLVMIHGYSASGNTFTHASLPVSAAAYFCKSGRDVWVVDLRTSSALSSCTYPWSMEQVGLIDIPAALMHIRNVSKQPVDVLAHCIGCVMLSMALLTDAKEVRDNTIELGPDTWLTSYQLGVLRAFNSQLPGQPHPVIRKLILSQKGPVLRYTDDNILRAFVMQSVRRWMMRDDYQFQPSDKPGVLEQLMDRLLASIPYPDADYDRENPFIWPLYVPWTATRHRMDALYGRAFDVNNMSPQTLESINDIFGPMNLDTVSQTIHFARTDSITNQAGRGEFVTRKRLRERWGGIDTYAIHGANNGLVDALTQTLLSQHLKSAGVPFSEPDPKSSVYTHLGHQDVLMGTRSHAVFDDLLVFLKSEVPPVTRYDSLPDVITLPWLGPRFALPFQPNDNVKIACLSDPTQGNGTLHLIPSKRLTSAHGERDYMLINDVRCMSQSSSNGSSADWMLAEPNTASMTPHNTEALQENQSASTALGWLALVIYPADETRARLSALDRGLYNAPVSPDNSGATAPAAKKDQRGSQGIRPDSARSPEPVPIVDRTFGGGIDHAINPLLWNSERIVNNSHLIRSSQEADSMSPSAKPVDNKDYIMQRVDDWLKRQRSDDLELAFVELSNIMSAQAMTKADKPSDSFAFALGSCQYVSGLLDSRVGQASLHRLAQLIETPERRVDFALFVGDQIYADATAGLIDPTRRDELYEQPNEKAMRASGMREVLRRIPTWMLLDDHELTDNWEPLPAKVARLRPEANRRNNHALLQGAHAYSKFQRMELLRPRVHSIGVGDLEFMAGGLPFRFADTRTGRSARGTTVPPLDRRILNKNQWRDLKKWLLQQGNKVKFVVTPSILLPRRCTTVAGEFNNPNRHPPNLWPPSIVGEIGSAHSDAWEAFPASMDELFALIVEKQILNTVFISGDEHHSMTAEAMLTSRRDAKKPAVKIVSVHSSGLYAPYPFANGHPDEMAQNDSFSLPSVNVSAFVRFAPSGDGFARLRVETKESGSRLVVQWIKSGGEVSEENIGLT
ncbi:MAG: hypothetical protein RIS44_1490 [Pseudomonadota bacterium]|jgi:choline dehydrogenase-like flavoprotein/pimeloyl-ACP methyl ester carboxylesterase